MHDEKRLQLPFSACVIYTDGPKKEAELGLQNSPHLWALSEAHSADRQLAGGSLSLRHLRQRRPRSPVDSRAACKNAPLPHADARSPMRALGNASTLQSTSAHASLKSDRVWSQELSGAGTNSGLGLGSGGVERDRDGRGRGKQVNFFRKKYEARKAHPAAVYSYAIVNQRLSHIAAAFSSHSSSSGPQRSQIAYRFVFTNSI